MAMSKQCRSLSSSPSASEPPKIQKELGGRKVIEWCCRALKPSPEKTEEGHSVSVRHTARLALSCSRKMSVLTWLGFRVGVGVGIGVEVWVVGRHRAGDGARVVL